MNIKGIIAKIYSLSRCIKQYYFIKWNYVKFYIKGVKIGDNMKVFTQMYLDVKASAQVRIGDNFTFTSGHCFNPLCRNIKGSIVAYSDAVISIGDNVGMSSPCIWAQKSITIGNHVNIGGDCIIMDSDAHSTNYIDRRNPINDKLNKKDAAIVIEDDVLIGTRCKTYIICA